MRWLVEVSPLGDKRDAKSLSYDADSWQGALQKARASLGDTGPLGAFTIDLLAEGYRAIDPVGRRRFVVKAAPSPSGAPPAMSAEAVAPAASPVAPPTDSASSVPDEAETSPLPLDKEPPSAPHTELLPPIAKPGAIPVAVPSAPAAAAAVPTAEPSVPKAAPSAPAAEPSAPAASLAPKAPGVPKAPASAPRVGGPPRPESPTAAKPRAAPAKSRWNATLLYKRELEPSSDSPLTYREFAYALPIGTDEAESERFAREQLDAIKEAIPADRRGAFVNVAVFDEIFTGKPTVPPLVVLQWKDWKGDPVVQYPRRAPIPLPPSLGSIRPPTPMSLPPPDFSAGGYAPSPAPMPAEAAADMFLGPAKRPSASGMVASSPLEAPPVAAIPPAALPGPAGSNGSILPAGIAAPPANVNISAAPPPAPAPSPNGTNGGARRVTGDELIADLFDEIHGLQFQGDAVDAGYFCLDLALAKIPARAALLHFFDIEKREFIVACARGTGIEQLLLARHPGTDACLGQATRTKQAVVISRVDPIPQRFGFTGGLDSAVLAPLWPHGRFVGAIEVINPSDGRPFTVDDANAFTYIAEQLAEYIGSRGIVLETPRLSRRPPPPMAR